YMHDVEHHTICYLRDLLVTSAHRDPTVTSFLTMWCYEEYWHGEALGRVLSAHGEPSGDARITPLRRHRRWRDRIDPLTHIFFSTVAGESFVAIHMAWGALNEWTTQAGYARLSQRAAHPVLTELLRRIMKQEGRHIDFYAGQAEKRLSDDRRARRLARSALQLLWRPVGANVMPQREVAFLVAYLFGGDGRPVAERIDRRVDRLPGLADLGLVTRAVDRYANSPAA
ncbi:MAG: ferritin-like domain-containing protein, partial [Acidimicrobiales bacterium]